MKADGAKERGLLAPCPMRLSLCLGPVDGGECCLDGFLSGSGLSGQEVVELFLGHSSLGLLACGLGLGGLVLLEGNHQIGPLPGTVEHETGKGGGLIVLRCPGIDGLGELDDLNVIILLVFGPHKLLDALLPLAHSAGQGEEVNHLHGKVARPGIGGKSVQNHGLLVGLLLLIGIVTEVFLGGAGGDNTIGHVLLQLLTGYVDDFKELGGGQGTNVLACGLVVVDLTGGGQGVGVGPLDSEGCLCVVSHAGEAVILVQLLDLDFSQDGRQGAVLVLSVVLGVQIELGDTLGGLVQSRVGEGAGLVGDG